MTIKVKDLKKGMRVVEYDLGTSIVSTIQEDARRVDEHRGEDGHYDGWEALAQPEEEGWEPFHYFECAEGSPYGPHIYLAEEKVS